MQKESLKILRIKAGLSQGELARLSGSTQASITRYESDVKHLRKASYNTLVALSKVLDVSVWDIDMGDGCEHRNRKI